MNKKNTKIIKFVCLVVVYFLLQIKFINDEWFGTDELDIMVLGKGIARGQLLYVDAISQHMPFSYYISAFFYKLGAVSVTEQRMAFYLLFALIWAGVVFLYKNRIDQKVLLLFPLFHCSMIQNYQFGTAVLSEHLAGCGAIILFLEFIIFSKERKLDLKNCIMISLSIVLMFGTIFVAIYPIFFIGVGVLSLEILWKKQENIKIKDWIILIFRKYIRLIIIVTIPWIILLCYFIATHSLGEFIYGAYTINREVYPKYNGGIGSNIFSVFFVPIDQLCSFITNGFNLNAWNYCNILQWIFILGSVIYFIKSFEKDGKIVGVISVLYVFSLGIRGIFYFHGTACVEVLAFMLAYVFCVYGFKNHSEFKKLPFIKRCCMIMIFILVMSGYCNNLSKITDVDFEEEQAFECKVIQRITSEDEGIWMVVFDNQKAMRADRFVVGTSAATPWMWEGIGKKQFKQFKKTAPRIAVFTEEHECWGYKIKDYAPEVVKYIKKNYTLMPSTSNVYVRNEYYEEACKKVNEANEN